MENNAGILEPTRAAPNGNVLDSVAAIEDALISLFGGFCQRIGLPRSLGQIFGLAFVNEGPVSFDAVVARLRLSKGSASQGIRWLREMRLLKPVALKRARRGGPERRGYFVPETDMTRLLAVIVRERIEQPMRSGATNLRELRLALAALRRAADTKSVRGVRHLNRRLRHLSAWHQKTLQLGEHVQRLAG